jgi:TfoX/Sxy family transcriptional regulator of competence genes
MSYNEKLADRVRELIAAAVLSEKKVEEKRMFSGLCFMVDDKMCVAVRPDSIMVRIDPVMSEGVMEKEGVAPMVHTGRVMEGFVFVDEGVLKTKRQLEYWVGLALEYNPRARSSKETSKKTSKRVKETSKIAKAVSKMAKGKELSKGKKMAVKKIR